MKVYVDLSDSDLRTIFHTLTIGSNNCNSNCMHKDCKNCWFKKGVDSLRKKFTNPQSLADYTNQVRKEVLGDLMNMLGDRAELIDCGGVAEFMFTTYDLTMCVKEILGEEKGETECQKN
jgi:hypothetical protein